MKNIFKLPSLLLLLLLTFGFSGCGDDDDEPSANCNQYITISQQFATDAQAIYSAFITSGNLATFCNDYGQLISEFQSSLNQASAQGCITGQDLTDAQASLNEAQTELNTVCGN